MGKRILVTGAGGIVGLRVAKQIIENLGNDTEFLLAVDRDDKSPWFGNENDREWLSANLDEVNDSWWKTIVQNYEINTIYYLETIENINQHEPSDETLERFGASDLKFINYLKSVGSIDELKVVYLSTDKMYAGDEFPNELNPMVIIQPEGNPESFTPLLNYATQKISSELSLLDIPNISLRIIRPFSIVSYEQSSDWPLTKTIIDAITGGDLKIYKDGRRGLAFTHVNDLATFINMDLFSTISRIINFCAVQNYLPEEFLIQKIKDKTQSSSSVIFTTDITFPYIMKTPQIRNMAKIYRPVVPIEMILEEIINAINPDPLDVYQPLEVTGVEYVTNNILQISGTSEPLSTVSIALGTGEHLVSNVLENGSWSVQTEDGIYYEEPTTGVAYASKDGNQYMTVIFDIPAANL